MLKKRFLPVFLLVPVFFSSCSKSPREAFAALKNLEGSWKSTGNVLVYDRWEKENDSLLKGVRFSVNNADTFLIQRFVIKNEGKSVGFFIDNNKGGNIPFRFVKAGAGRVVFEQAKYGYPQRIIIGFPRDSLYWYRQENLKGNKPLFFKMKRK